MIHRLMMSGIALAALAGCATVPDAAAQTAPPAADAASDAGTIFDTRIAEHFGDATAPLKAYLAAASPSPAGPQHFCIVGYDRGEGGKAAQVHWREGNRLILWEGASDPAYAADAIRQSRRNLDLVTDVVATDADINGSTYLVTQAWVDRVLSDCAARGAQYTVTR